MTLQSEDDRPPQPLVLDGIRYQQDFPLDTKDPEGAHLAAYDEATQERLWIVLVYSTGPHGDSPFGQLNWYFRSIKAVSGRRALELEVLRGPRFLFDLETRSAEMTWEPPREPGPAPMSLDELDDFIGRLPGRRPRGADVARQCGFSSAARIRI